MEREANYAAVGAFVLLVVAMAGLFVYWYADARERRSYTRYEMYFDGSVSGLTRGAAVRYLGVDVGRVFAMHIDPRSASRVQIIADIDSSTPISSRTVAQLSMQGVTGVLYIDLLQNTDSTRLSELVPSERYPVIRSTRSNFDVLLSSLPQLVGVATGTLDRADRMLSDPNIAAVAHSLGNIDRATAALPDAVHDMRALVSDMRKLSNELSATNASVQQIAQDSGPRLHDTLVHIDKVADNLVEASDRLDAMIGENRAQIANFTHQGLPELEQLVHDGRDAAGEIRDLARSLRENPSQLLYQPAPQGVEIAR
ncbi:MAG TPA: MlaD family protein [Steroidobacteraceae bacterium]|nr:MlaD family protein [Steroidobacteraceae bacterium]